MGLCEQYPGLFCPSDLPSRQQMVLGFLKQSETVTQTVTNSPSESLELMSDTILGQPEEKLLEQISQGQFLAWAGKVEDAKAAEEKIMLTIQNLRLKNDARIASEMNKLGVMIQEKECELAARELDALLQIGMRYLTFSEYRMAFGTGEEIMALLENHPQCNLPHNDSIDRLTKLGPIIKYLEMIEDATSYYQSASSGMYPEFFRKYLEAEIYFENQGLAQQGLSHLALSDFIISSGNVELAKAGVVFMAEQAETFASETVSLLLFLKNQGLSISQTQAIQEFAGQKLARYFFSRGTGVKPEALVHSLTHNDQWFRTFERTFIRHWGQ
jgi:tetratricopeptide (TPR) repeat protein